MRTFSQWWKSFSTNKVVKQITWVCGDEPVLVDEVVNLITSSVHTDDLNYSVIDASELSPRAVWNELLQLPFGTQGARTSVVLHADGLLDTPQFESYVRSRGKFPRNYVIFVADSAALPREEVARGRGELVKPLLFLKTRGTLIECRAFTASSAKWAVEWVKSKGNIRGQVAVHLLNRATGDLRLVRDTLAKLELFPGEITIGVVNEILEDRPDDAFLDALFGLDKKTALAALKELPRDQHTRALGLVDARLELAGLVHDMLVERKSPGEIARAAGNKSFLVPDILPFAKYYDKKRRLRIRSVLAVLDEYTVDYSLPDGAMHALVASW